jgi:hypothetical protein
MVRSDGEERIMEGEKVSTELRWLVRIRKGRKGVFEPSYVL